MIKYPKEIMSIKELVAMGFTKTQMYQAAHHFLSDKYTMRTSGGGKILFDTAAFEKERAFVLGRND